MCPYLPQKNTTNYAIRSTNCDERPARTKVNTHVFCSIKKKSIQKKLIKHKLFMGHFLPKVTKDGTKE